MTRSPPVIVAAASPNNKARLPRTDVSQVLYSSCRGVCVAGVYHKSLPPRLRRYFSSVVQASIARVVVHVPCCSQCYRCAAWCLHNLHGVKLYTHPLVVIRRGHTLSPCHLRGPRMGFSAIRSHRLPGGETPSSSLFPPRTCCPHSRATRAKLELYH